MMISPLQELYWLFRPLQAIPIDSQVKNALLLGSLKNMRLVHLKTRMFLCCTIQFPKGLTIFGAQRLGAERSMGTSVRASISYKAINIFHQNDQLLNESVSYVSLLIGLHVYKVHSLYSSVDRSRQVGIFWLVGKKKYKILAGSCRWKESFFSCLSWFQCIGGLVNQRSERALRTMVHFPNVGRMKPSSKYVISLACWWGSYCLNKKISLGLVNYTCIST